MYKKNKTIFTVLLVSFFILFFSNINIASAEVTCCGCEESAPMERGGYYTDRTIANFACRAGDYTECERVCTQGRPIEGVRAMGEVVTCCECRDDTRLCNAADRTCDTLCGDRGFRSGGLWKREPGDDIRPPSEDDETEYEVELIPPTLNVDIPGTTNLFGGATIEGEEGKRYFFLPWIGQYAGALYRYILSVIGILAAVVIIFAGAMWMTAGGNAERIKRAQEYVFGAVVGLVIAFGSYLLLYTINPDLVKFGAMKLRIVERVSFVYTLAEGNGGFDAENYSGGGLSIRGVTGDTPAGRAAATCREDPGDYEGRVSNLRAIVPEWIDLCRNGCAYFKGGFTNGCHTTSSGGERMARSFYCTLESNNLHVPEGCERYIEVCPSGETRMDNPEQCFEPLARHYHDYAAVPTCDAGFIIGDCLTWVHQLMECAGRIKHRIPQYRANQEGRTSLAESEYLVYQASGIEAALAEMDRNGGLRYGDVFWSNAFGHNFMYIEEEILEMGGLGNQRVSVPNVGSFGTVKTWPFDRYIDQVRRKEQGKTGSRIHTFIYRPYDF